MADECIPSPRTGQACVLPYTWDAHLAGHRTEKQPEHWKESHWATTPQERDAMREAAVHE